MSRDRSRGFIEAVCRNTGIECMVEDECKTLNWRKHLPWLAGQLQIHGPVTQEFINLGYENDDQWLTLLDSITPDTRPGVWPEFLSPEYIRQMQKQHKARLRIYPEKRGVTVTTGANKH